MKVIERLISSVRNAALFNKEVQIKPACILWTDSERQWESIILRLQTELPELLVLGDYDPNQTTGPAIWLRCAIADKIKDLTIPADKIPILYLPGISRQNLRTVESCPDSLKPILELQYRGVIWSQINSKDWTILAFLKTDQGGLGLVVAQDYETKLAAALALNRFLDEEIELLKGKYLDKDYFNTLLTGGDPIRDLLQWIDSGDAFKASRSENEWKAFVELIKSQYNFDPQKEGVLAGAAKLAEREGPWLSVWERFSEAPRRYLNIPGQIRKCAPPSDTIFWQTEKSDLFGGWIQWNEEQENKLHSELLSLASVPPHEARKKIKELEKHHGDRRSLVWADLGESPLAKALKYLSILAENTGKSLAVGTADELAINYSNSGWKSDDAMIKALAEVEKKSDLQAVSAAIRSIYLPWIEESARYLQKLVDGQSYPGGTISNSDKLDYKDGDCILFVDGLRIDTGKRLAKMLTSIGLEVSEKLKWTTLPSVTATGKNAVTPIRDKISGSEISNDFEPCVAETGQSLKGGYHLKKLLKDNNWKILEKSDDGDGKGNAWCEFGDIDHEGHDRGWKLAKHLEVLLREIRDRIDGLLNAGWKRVHIVTDHGWLLLPGGLPKIELPSALTSSKWGRCASIKAGAATKERLFPWFWNPNVHFALADGISCFKAGEEYAHGGLSLQECLTLEIFVSSANQGNSKVEFTDIVWKGLRCTITVEGSIEGLSLDIRTEPGNLLTSVVVASKPLKENGTASVVIENEDLEGHVAMLVLLDNGGNLIAQIKTKIGGVK